MLRGLAQEASPAPERDRATDRLMVPRRFVEEARWVAAHSDPVRWDAMYRVLFRILHENRRLLEAAADPDVSRFAAMSKQTHRDEHKMRAFVHFRRFADNGAERYVAWYRPDHHIVQLAAPFFAERFASMRWSILTPDACVHWTGTSLEFTPGVDRRAPPTDDELEELWRTCYASVSNPARVKALGDDVNETALAFMPEDRSLPSLRRAAASCQGCALFARATQTVFGEGPGDARIVLVGEQPGDEEDIKGRPFVGPAGDVLDRALAGAGVERAAVYVTNTVKHFSWEPRGKRRIHQTPRLSEMRACRPWLEAELEALRPSVLVALGSTAARAIFGPQFRVLSERGQVRRTSWAEHTVATLHPSAVLRADSPKTADQYFAWIVDDLRLALEASAGHASQAQARL